MDLVEYGWTNSSNSKAPAGYLSDHDVIRKFARLIG